MRLFLILAFILMPSGAGAQTLGNTLDGLQIVTIILNDEDVMDGCLPNPSRLVDLVEQELRRSGVELSDDFEQGVPGLFIFANGVEGKFTNGRGTGSCSGGLGMQLVSCGDLKLDFQKTTRLQCVASWTRFLVFTGPKPIQRIFENAAREIIEAFGLDLERDRAGIELE